MKLRKCPFCGAEPPSVIDFEIMEAVACTDCQALGPRWNDETPEGRVKSWNTRAGESAMVECGFGPEAGVCEWIEDDGCWKAACKFSWEFTNGGTPTEHGIWFCHCGKRIKVVESEPAQDHATMVSDGTLSGDDLIQGTPTDALQAGLGWIESLESGVKGFWPGDAALYVISALLRREIERRK